MKRKGFTLIELLAVIIILGILMLIAIPSVTSYINNSRKQSYIDTTKQLIKGASLLVNGNDLDISREDTTYYIPTSCIPLESGSTSPYGKIDSAYVVVTYDGDNYNYYYTGKDEAGMGIKNVTFGDDLNKDIISSDIREINPNTAVGDRTQISVVSSSDCCTMTPGEVQKYVNDDGTIPEIEYPEGKNKGTVEKGDIVKIADEEFYVLKHDGDDLVLLGKYNLKVGYIYDVSTGEYIREYTSADPGYNRQSSEVLGSRSNATIYNGVLRFSTSNYWYSEINTDKYPGEICGTLAANKGCKYVFNEQNYLYNYLSEYADYLRTKGANVKSFRVPDISEYRIMPSSFSNSTSYWTASLYSTGNVFGIVTGGHNAYYFSTSGLCGLRPVIII